VLRRRHVVDLPTPGRQACEGALCPWVRFVTIPGVLEAAGPADAAYAGPGAGAAGGSDQRLRAASTARWLAQESIDRLEPADRIDPIEANEPMHPIDRALPIDPIESTEPVEPMLSTEPVERIDRIEPRASGAQRDLLVPLM
jgi:hypothetical protein